MHLGRSMIGCHHRCGGGQGEGGAGLFRKGLARPSSISRLRQGDLAGREEGRKGGKEEGAKGWERGGRHVRW